MFELGLVEKKLPPPVPLFCFSLMIRRVECLDLKYSYFGKFGIRPISSNPV